MVGLRYICSGEITPIAIGMLAEIASCQMEYSYLAKATGRSEYQEKVCYMLRLLRLSLNLSSKSERIMKSLVSTNISALGMLPMRIDMKTGDAFGSMHSLLVFGCVHSYGARFPHCRRCRG